MKRTGEIGRRRFVGSAAAGLVLAPFLNLGTARTLRAAGTPRQAKRLVLFCTMGTHPQLWAPVAVSGETITTYSKMTEPLAAVKDKLILVEGLPSGNPADNHGAPDGLTGLGYGYYNGQLKVSVDQFVAQRLVAGGITRPIASLLLGAETRTGNGSTMFFGGTANGGNTLPTIGSPLSAFTTAFGSALPTGVSASALLKRRRSILDLVTGEANTLKNSLGRNQAAKLDLHLTSIRELENKLGQGTSAGGGAGGCATPTMPGDDSKYTFSNAPDAIASNAVHLDIIVSALACDVTRVAALEFGNDQKLMVNLPGRLPYDDQHNGFLHSGAASGFKNLIEFERYMSEQFVALVNKLAALPDPEDPAKTLLDTTVVAWCRDMGDAVNHDMKSMRFVLASGPQGYLKTAAGGRYIKSSERHERVLLNLCEAMGIATYKGFGDPDLAAKSPLPGIAA